MRESEGGHACPSTCESRDPGTKDASTNIDSWILHGDADTVVHIRATHQFVDLVREMLPETEIRLDIAPLEEHGFDLRNVAWELYTIGAMDYVKKSWLRT